MSYGNEVDSIYFDEYFDEILNIIWEDVFGDYDCSHIGTFAEIKSVPNTENIKTQKDKIAYKWVDIDECLRRMK